MEPKPLIVGAGPVGLAAAVFLAREGVPVRVIDAASHRSQQSRALAVNPRTLEILEATGVTGRMLAIGKRINRACVRRGHRLVATVSFASLPHRYAFMLALSQRTTERLLEETLQAMGVEVEREVALQSCRNACAGVEVDLEDHGEFVTEHVPWLLAADGAHSKVRDSLGIGFGGSGFERAWRLADVPMRTALDEDAAHVIFLKGGGFLFMLRVITGEDGPGHLWRLITNREEPLEELAPGDFLEPPEWASSFHIAHRVASEFQAGGAFLAGDAAHIHSPIGARGMNLGIEDAWTFAEYMRLGRREEYAPQRRRVDGKTVRRIAAFTRLARGETLAARTARAALVPAAARIPPLRRRLLRLLSGLDHPLSPPARS